MSLSSNAFAGFWQDFKDACAGVDPDARLGYQCALRVPMTQFVNGLVMSPNGELLVVAGKWCYTKRDIIADL